jgi:hypothetical protein
MNARPPRAVIVVSACALTLLVIGPLLAAQTQKPSSAAQKTAPVREVDGGWPRDYATSKGLIKIYQPQIASWDDQRHIVAFAAVGYTPFGASKPSMGTVKFETETSVALADRLVSLSPLKLTESHFANLPNDQLRDVVDAIQQLVPEGSMVIALDRVLARLDKSRIIPKNVAGIKADPPVIFYSTSSAVLLNIDGDPVWSPIRENDLKFAVNTNWDLFEYQPTKAFFLRHGNSWLTAADLQGPWKPAGTLPDSFAKLPPEEGWKDVKAALPGTPLTTTPKVFVSTKPAELILLHGAPNYLTVAGTKLLWVSNTDVDVYRLGKTGTVYFLVSGRWFSAPDFTGPWTFATPTLPEDFKKIPVSHERSRVLASVPGTDQAIEGVLLAQIPQTARVSKKEIKAPEVQFQGDPQFQPIEQTTVSRAVNTDKDIIKVGDLYYMCFQGVWFVGKSANGPWEAASSVPKEIYEIPASSPAYNVTNVTIIEDNDDEVVYAATAAYTGLMIGWGCAVWGTGYYYPPYIGYGGFYPAYYPYYPTYGYYASYNPWTGSYGRGMVAYGPYGGAGVGARYNPRTGTYARGAAAWGPYGARGVASAYNPRTGAVGTTRQGSSIYGSWGQTAVRRGDQWASTSRVTNNRGTTTRATQGSGGGEAITRRGPQGTSGVARTGSGDVYAGRDGNVYRKQEGGGGWQKYENGGWNNTQQPTPQQREQAQQRATEAQLNRDAAARAEGAQRTRDASRASSSSRSGSSSSYRPSGGMSRGGGFRGGGGRRR